jgi:glyceraldehyde 3-phosphate dehydrogenase
MAQNGSNERGLKLGINGFGRIGKLTLWQQVGRKYFDESVVNIGRSAGTSLSDIAQFTQRDSTYGSLHGFLYGYTVQPLIETLNEDGMRIDGVRGRFLRSNRNAEAIEDVRPVVDTTGQFLDPTEPAEALKGALRGHLAAGGQHVIASAPFKIKAKSTPMPEDAVTTVMGINDNDFDPRRHKLISNASCTTNCLAHMIKPLLNAFGTQRILSASMATGHAATGSQQVLDRLPKTGKTDLLKNRSILNNIILTITGAAKALALVIPDMANIGRQADTFVKATIGVMCLPSVALAQYPESLIRTILDISHNAVHAVLFCLLVLLWKSLREAIVRPDNVETAFKGWSKFLGLRKKGRVWFVVLYVITGMSEYIGRKPQKKDTPKVR